MECTIPDDLETPEPTQEGNTLVEQSSSGDLDDFWVVHVDGSSNSTGLGDGLLLLGLEGFIIEYALRFDFPTINNEAEYEALLVGLRIARKLKVQKLRICTDSQLVVGQMKGDFEAQEENMEYLQKMKDPTPVFTDFDIRQVLRSENSRADLLSKLATSAPRDLP